MTTIPETETTTTRKKPFAFEASYELYNARGERLRNVLLIENPGSGQVLQLDIVNILVGETIKLNTIESAPGPDKDKHHFRLHFAPGAATDRAVGVLGEDWAVARTANAQQGIDVYLAWRSPSVTLAPGDRLVIELQGVSAGGRAGTEVTMELSWPTPDTAASSTSALVITPAGPNPGEYEVSYNLVLGVRDRRGRPDIPLRAGFVGPNKVLNVDNVPNTLKLRLMNSAPETSQEKLRFRYDANEPAFSSRLVIALPFGAADAQPWALGIDDQVNGVKVESGDDWKVDGPRKIGGMVEWELSPTKDVELAPQAYVDVTLSSIVTGHPSGVANLELRYSAVAGYWDGEILCAIEKAPLVFGGKDKAAHVEMGNPGEIRSTGPILLRSDSNNDNDDSVMRVFRQDGNTPALELKSAGQMILGAGDTVPGKLTIHADAGTCALWADAHPGSTARVDLPGDLHLGSHGTYNTAYIQARDDQPGTNIALQFRTQKDGRYLDAMLITTEGRVRDKTGFLVPVGTIVAYGGTTAPEGWLLCHAQRVSRTTYADLFAVIGTTYGDPGPTQFSLPELRTRVPVGAYSGAAYTLGAMGGEATVTLTAAQMPAHTHGVTDPGHSHAVRCTNAEGRGNLLPNRDLADGEVDHPSAHVRTGISLQSAGSGAAHNNMQPYTVVNYIIKY